MSVLYLYPVTSVTTGQRIPGPGVHTARILRSVTFGCHSDQTRVYLRSTNTSYMNHIDGDSGRSVSPIFQIPLFRKLLGDRGLGLGLGLDIDKNKPKIETKNISPWLSVTLESESEFIPTVPSAGHLGGQWLGDPWRDAIHHIEAIIGGLSK